MKRNSIAGLLLTILLALLHGRPILATECPENAAQPIAITVAYGLQTGRQRNVKFNPMPDGVLRALDAESGGELWTFTPPGLDLTHRADGLMSDARVLRFDSDLNGSIEPALGDKVWLYFGMRRGGRQYYALDVTSRTAPQILWKAGPPELPGVGETWATPTVARVRIAGAAQNGEHLVVILGGGYDEAAGSAHRIFMVDAADGQLLWYAGGVGTGSPDLLLPQMTDPIAARVSALDTSGDGFADRLYAADVGGHLWRFDVWNGRDRSQLVTGGMFAALAGSAPEDLRRFFNAPDVALVQRRGAAPFFNLALGSGNRAAPFDGQTHDRFYSVRDRNPFERLSQSSYDALVPITDLEPLDITDTLGSTAVPVSAPGWKLELRLNGGWSGEKVLAEALTARGVILFPTYKPISETACTGENRLYALNIDQGEPALDFDDDGQISGNDLSTPLTQPGIAGEVEISLASKPDSNGDSGGSTNDPPASEMACKVGPELLRLCVPAAGQLRTFWQRNAAD